MTMKSTSCTPGCNVENASYGLTVCAERVAIYNAVAGGDTEISAMAVCWCVPLQCHTQRTHGVPL